MTRETILQVVWGTDISVESRTVDMHIRTLRKKLGDAGRYICTVRKVGYKLADSEEGEGRMKPQSMEEKISYRLFFMGFVGLVCTAVLCLFVFHKAFREQAWTSLEHQADLVSAGYEQLSSPDQLSVFVNGDLRITLIAADGSVVFESATDQQMENHLSRPEIQQAMREGVGRNCRDSQTMGYETYYYAMLLPGGDILRVAQDSETIWSIYDAALPAIILSCILMMGARSADCRAADPQSCPAHSENDG